MFRIFKRKLRAFPEENFQLLALLVVSKAAAAAHQLLPFARLRNLSSDRQFLTEALALLLFVVLSRLPRHFAIEGEDALTEFGRTLEYEMIRLGPSVERAEIPGDSTIQNALACALAIELGQLLFHAEAYARFLEEPDSEFLNFCRTISFSATDSSLIDGTLATAVFKFTVCEQLLGNTSGSSVRDILRICDEFRESAIDGIDSFLRRAT